MAQVSVTIAGRVYRMACGDGEEAHLEQLAQELDARIVELKKAFGEIGDQRLTVMAAISLGDERAEALRRIARLEGDIERLKETTVSAETIADGSARRVARALDEAATRIESVARGMDGIAKT